MKSFKYKGMTIEIDDNEEPEITLVGEAIDVKMDSEAGTCSSAELPYRAFSSLDDLARAVVDQRGDN